MLDYVIDNVQVVDPESRRVFEGAVGLIGSEIAGLYEPCMRKPAAHTVIDAKGHVLLPGFIDIHAHSDNDIPCAQKLLAQGVTTVLSGNCGFSPADLPAFIRETQKGYPLNQAIQVGHDTLRNAVGLTDIFTAATPEEITAMQKLAEQAFEQGAWGLSFGLEYDPGASNDELKALARVAADAGRMVSIHVRCDAGHELEGLQEALELSVQTGAYVQISHLVYMYVKDLLPEAIALIERYRVQGARIGVDSGMYTAWCTYVYSPSFSEEGLANMGVPYETLIIADGPHAGEAGSRELIEHLRAEADHTCVICDPGAQGDVERALKLADVMLSTDCGKAPVGQGHPQAAASYPLFFRRFVFDTPLFDLVEAARRTSYLPAQAMGLPTKGRIAVGADADLVMIDPTTYNSEAGFPGRGNPDARPTGVDAVFVNGVLVEREGCALDVPFAGRALVHK